MSCLTRSMQKQLSQYIKRNVDKTWRQKPEQIRDLLVNKGVCPSDVTSDQVSVILEGLES